ncbi:MAG: hypothetical protein H6807_06020 [Planctomycetes bacterium]|nr:hypothetical protein [Planctomycetota bacterium]
MTGKVSSGSRSLRAEGKTRVCDALRRMLVLGLVSTLITLCACSGGGFNPNNNGGGVANLAVTITNVATVTSGGGQSAVRVDFTVQGEAGQTFDLLFQYFIDANMNGMRDSNEPLLNMTEASMALETQLGITSSGDLSGFSASQSMASATFLWQAGADLGFVGTAFGVVITPSNGMAGQAVVAGATTGAMTYTAGNPPATYMGSIGGAGSGNGRTDHTEALVSDLGSTAILSDNGNEVLIIGGRNSANDLSNIDRFSIDGNTQTANASGTFNSANVRREHASASFFNGTAIRVLVCGGSIAGAPTATADIYSFGPSGAESVSTTSPMNTPRRAHSACWLPDNRIFVFGGFDAANNALASAEIYDPATGSFSGLIFPMGVPARVMHTCSLLPNGMVLIAGGHDGANGALNAFLYDPRSGTWTDTGTQVDRVGHSATMLVNGICALVGGRTNAGAVLNSVTFYRTFSETDTSGTLPVGFTTVSGVNLAISRAEHGASRLGDGSLLFSGGFDGLGSTLNSSEVFIPSKFTDPAIGFFTQTNPGLVAGMDLASSRARHTQTTTATGSAAVVGGVTGTTGSNTVLDTIEVFQFQNGAPSVSNISASGSVADLTISFSLADAEGDCSFVIVRYSTDGGSSFHMATLTDFKATVNLAPGTRTVHWSASTDGVANTTGVIVEIIPVGGVIGAPARTTL